MIPRRLGALSAAAVALVVAACSTSTGAPEPTNTSISGLGVLASQPPLAAAPGGSTVLSVPNSILVAETRTAPEITDPRVFMEGDSVLRGMAIGTPDAIDLYIGALGWDVTVDAEVGRFTDEGVANVKRRRNEVAQVVVAMLGNNYDGDEVAFADEVLDLLGSFPDVRVFVMFTVPLYREDRAEVNEVLRQTAQYDDRLVLIDWERMTRDIPGVLSSDRLHPTGYGVDVLAQAVGITLGLAPGAGPDVTLPAFGSSTRPPLAAGTDTNKGETSNDGSTRTTSGSSGTTAPRATVATTTTTLEPGTTRPTSTNPATTTTRPGTGVPTTTAAGSTSSTAPAPSTAPTTAAPTTVAPTAAPTTAGTTAAPTAAPTTAAPTTAPPPAT